MKAVLMYSFAIFPYSLTAVLLGALTDTTASLENGTEDGSREQNALCSLGWGRGYSESPFNLELKK